MRHYLISNRIFTRCLYYKSWTVQTVSRNLSEELVMRFTYYPSISFTLFTTKSDTYYSEFGYNTSLSNDITLIFSSILDRIASISYQANPNTRIALFFSSYEANPPITSTRRVFVTVSTEPRNYFFNCSIAAYPLIFK